MKDKKVPNRLHVITARRICASHARLSGIMESRAERLSRKCLKGGLTAAKLTSAQNAKLPSKRILDVHT